MTMNEKLTLIFVPLLVGLLIAIFAIIIILLFRFKKYGRIYHHEVDHTGDGFIDGYE